MARDWTDLHEPGPLTRADPQLDPGQVVGAFVDSVRLWPAGAVSAVGTLTIAAALFVEIAPAMDLGTTEYLATLVVGGVLALAGPVTANVQIGTANRSASGYAKEIRMLEESKRRAEESDRVARGAERPRASSGTGG